MSRKRARVSSNRPARWHVKMGNWSDSLGVFTRPSINSEPRQQGRLSCRFRYEPLDRRTTEQPQFLRDGGRDPTSHYHCTPHQHFSVSTVPHSIGLDGADAACRRLPFRLEIQLRLQPILVAILASPVLGPHSGLRAEARRRRHFSSWLG